MSYVYRERERDRDYDDRNVTIKRYVIPSDERDDRREFMMSRDDSYGDHELVIRRKTEREEPVSIQRYERDVEYEPPVRRYEREYYEPRYVSPRQSEYDVDEEYYRRRVDDRHSRRDLSPGDSVSQVSRRRGRTDYSSDDDYYYHEETRTYDGDHPHHRRHLAEGALVGAGAAELFRSHRKREGEEVSHGMGHAVKTAGAGALGAVAVNAASHVRDYYRSKSRSRHRARSFDDDRSSHRHSHHSHGRRSRSRSRSHSHSRAKTLMEVGLGAAAIAAGVAALRNKKSTDERRSRSRTRSRSRARSSLRADKDDASSASQRNKHIAGAGLAGAAVAGLVEHHRSKSRSRKGERSHSRLRQALPVVAAGLGTAAATGLWEKKKAEKEGNGSRSRGTSRSGRSLSRGAPDSAYPDPTRDSAGLIEYGKDPVTGSIPAEHYYGAPTGADAPYYSDGGEYSRRRSRSRSRSRSRGGRRNDSSSGSDRGSRRRHRKHRSRSRDIAGAALGATGLGYAAHRYSQSRERKKAEREQDRARYDNVIHHDPYEESYDPEPYPASPRPGPNYQEPPANYYPNTNSFPPPPGSTTNLNQTPPPNAYNPADYPPPPGAAPQPQPYNYGAPGPGTEQYAPRPRRVDENVSAQQRSTLPTDHHTYDGLANESQIGKANSLPRPRSQSESPASKSVSFNLDSDNGQLTDPGYETEDSDSTIEDGRNHQRHRPRRSSSVPHPPMSHARSPSHYPGHANSQRHSSASLKPYKTQEQDSDSTIELPERFDRKGRLLKEKEDDPTVAKIEDFINRFTKVLF
ncbi:uncharacterized protein N7484_001557 [Penicillium longicatenatum]|uniref:uncharacterized protein n=1 Tax=Penicillium longicatenatum TaxID=1561947 RepID=UPI00254799F5|nr:uncharacterized protein N7484_001557 [Penicillium longicatenatum]KAJ5657908.1 hypothetical protein N7484_001557 [Penicillium longicatenatum]